MFQNKYKLLKLISIIGTIISLIVLFTVINFFNDYELTGNISLLSFFFFSLLNIILLSLDLIENDKYKKIGNALIMALIFIVVVLVIIEVSSVFNSLVKDKQSQKELTYNKVLNSEHNDYIGKEINWKAELRTHGPSDGTFWIIDNEHQTKNRGEYDWFFALPPLDEIRETEESWLKSWAGIEDPEGSTFLIDGILEEKDCGYYGKEGPCIPRIKISEIEKIDNKKEEFEKNSNSMKIDTLYNEYMNNIKKEEEELKSLLKQDKNIKFVTPKEIRRWNDSSDDDPKNLTLNCGEEKVEFIFTPDSYIKQSDKNDISNDWVGIRVVNKNNGEVLRQKKLHNDFGLSQLKFNGLKYYIIEDYTGSIHCCHKEIVAVCKNDRFTIGDAFDFKNNGGLGDFFIKDDQIYYMKSDGKFDYFNLCYAISGPMESQSFYKLDHDSMSFVDVSKEFPDYYSELAKKQNDWLIKFKNYHPNFFSGHEELWYFPLIRRLTASYLSGESKEVYKKNFIEDFNYFIDSSTSKSQSFLSPIEKEDIEGIFNKAMKILIYDDRATSSEMLIEEYLENQSISGSGLGF